MNYNKKTIMDVDVAGKKILLRCDFNVPQDKATGAITSDKRIVAALPTIRYLLERGAAVIACSHLGKPKGQWKESLTLAPVAERLSRLLGQEVIFAKDIMHETLDRSDLGTLHAGSKVNVERAMAANGRFGGHIVSGHIDGTGTIANMEREENAVWVTIETTPQIMKYIIEKGSIAIDGISLTVATVSTDRFQVSIIPHTGQETTLLTKKAGDIVNLENDVIGKYVEHLLHFKEPDNKKQSSKVDMGFLAEHGFL